MICGSGQFRHIEVSMKGFIRNLEVYTYTVYSIQTTTQYGLQYGSIFQDGLLAGCISTNN